MTAAPVALLPEVPEARATGPTKAIYDEIKRLSGVPMAALIFRHLATVPGALEWAWGALRPLFASGRLQEAAWRIARETRYEPLGAIARDVLGVRGVDDAGLREIHAVLGAYNRANPVNLLAVSCLLRALDGASGTPGPSGTKPWIPPAPAGSLPPMIDIGAMRPHVAEILFTLASRGEPVRVRVVPSLYRHFGHRPQFLALLAKLLVARFRDGSIARGAASVRAAMDAAADDLVLAIAAPPAPDKAIAATLRSFGTETIPEMIAVGAIIQAALPER